MEENNMRNYQSLSIPVELVNEMKKHIERSNFGYRSVTEFTCASVREMLKKEKQMQEISKKNDLIKNERGDTNVNNK